jgi:hypothetical protein
MPHCGNLSIPEIDFAVEVRSSRALFSQRRFESAVLHCGNLSVSEIHFAVKSRNSRAFFSQRRFEIASGHRRCR